MLKIKTNIIIYILSALLFYLLNFKLMVHLNLFLNFLPLQLNGVLDQFFFTNFQYLITLIPFISITKLSLVYLTIFLFFITLYLNKYILQKSKKIVITILLTLTIFILFLIFEEKLISFLLYYEVLLLPSVILVFLKSPNKRSYQTSLYFLSWTQAGSFLFLLGVLYIYNYVNVNSFYFLFKNNFFKLPILFLMLIFIGLGIKIPIWPFHFWLTKTHVEANTSFSILLSGLLVKTALIGSWKIREIFIPIYTIIISTALITIFDVTFKLNWQVDFKKLIAYLTVQEMSFLYFFTLSQTNNYSLFFIKFIWLHTILSGVFFFFNELIYIRYGSRQLNLGLNFLENKKNLTILFYLILLLFIGLPFTLKFFIEIILMINLLNFVFWIFFIIFIMLQLISMLFFFKNTITFLFSNYSFNNKKDLRKIEFTITTYLIIPLFYFILI